MCTFDQEERRQSEVEDKDNDYSQIAIKKKIIEHDLTNRELQDTIKRPILRMYAKKKMLT